MSHPWLQAPGLAGAAFAGACCVGAGPVLASAAVASGLGFLTGIFNIYVLGPLVAVSVAWTLWTGYRMRARGGGPGAAFWVMLAGGLVVVAGVFLPPLAAGTRALATALIYAGLVGLLGGAAWGALARRRRPAAKARP